MPLDNPANTVQEAWKTPTLVNNWANYGTPYNPAGYWKDTFGVVHLRGTLQVGSTGTIMFVLPAGYGPANREALNTACFSSAVGYGVARVDVYTDGSIFCQQGVASGTNIAFFLDGLTFRST